MDDKTVLGFNKYIYVSNNPYIPCMKDILQLFRSFPMNP